MDSATATATTGPLADLAAGADHRDLGQVGLDKLRSQLDRDLFAFCWAIFGYQDIIGTLHGDLCAIVEDWTDGKISSRVIVQTFRESFKTSILARANSLWQTTRNPDLPVVIFNERLENTQKWVRAIRDVVQGSHLFQDVYRDLLPPGVHYSDTRSKPHWWKWSDTELMFQRGRLGIPEASITGTGIEAATTGGHWPVMILDDLISLKAALSPAEMERAREWVRNHVYLMRPAEKGRSLCVCTPWTYNDIYVDMVRDFGYEVYRRQALENGESIFPQKLSTEELLKMQARDPYTFCTPAETPITMADWSTKPISLVNVGDEIVGMKLGDGRRYLVRATVLDKGKLEAPVFEFATEDGFVRCTESHEWLRNKRGYGPITWFERGCGFPQRLARVHPVDDCPYPEEAAWLSGFYDGDGSISGITPNGSGGFLTFTQSVHHHEVNDRLRYVLDLLGFEWKAFHRLSEREGWSDTYLYRMLGGLSSKARFVQWCSPAKRAKIINTMFSGRSICTWPQVKTKVPLGVQEAYWLHTTTGNYIAWGCVSKNSSQMMATPRPGRDVAFDPDWLRYGSVTVSDDSEPEAFVIDPASYDPTIVGEEGLDEETPPRIVPLYQMEKIVLWDPAPSEARDRKSEPRARNGIVAEGIDPWARRFILEAIGSRDDPLDTIQRVFTMMDYWGTDVLGIEEVTFSKLYRHWIQDLCARTNRYVRIITLEPGKQHKDTRILSRNPGCRQGHYYLNQPLTQPFVQEYVEFPYGETRDILDAWSYDECMNRPYTTAERTRLRRQSDRLREFETQDSEGRAVLVTGY